MKVRGTGRGSSSIATALCKRFVFLEDFIFDGLVLFLMEYFELKGNAQAG